jgi:hypothetical protein
MAPIAIAPIAKAASDDAVQGNLEGVQAIVRLLVGGNSNKPASHRTRNMALPQIGRHQDLRGRTRPYTS